MSPLVSNPKAIAELGERIYREQYKDSYEREHPGKFVAIDIATGKAYMADAPEVALETARTASPNGVFHLIQVGFSGAIRVSYSNDPSTVDWIFR
jgi:alpha-galactosidase